MIREQLRFSSIKIESPIKVGEVWVHLEIEKILWEDGEIKEIIPRWGRVSKQASKFQTDIKTFYDPILQKDTVMSGAGVTLGVLSFVLPWVAEKYGGEINEEGVLWL